MMNKRKGNKCVPKGCGRNPPPTLPSPPPPNHPHPPPHPYPLPPINHPPHPHTDTYTHVHIPLELPCVQYSGFSESWLMVSAIFHFSVTIEFSSLTLTSWNESNLTQVFQHSVSTVANGYCASRVLECSLKTWDSTK